MAIKLTVPDLGSKRIKDMSDADLYNSIAHGTQHKDAHRAPHRVLAAPVEWAPQIHAGDVVRWPHLSASNAPIDERDIARVAVDALCDDGHAGADNVLTGPDSWTQFEQLSIIGRVISRTLRSEEISPDEARQELLSIMPAGVVNMLLNAWAAAIGQPAFVTSTDGDITGVPARPFVDWVADHSAEFRA